MFMLMCKVTERQRERIGCGWTSGDWMPNGEWEWGGSIFVWTDKLLIPLYPAR